MLQMAQPLHTVDLSFWRFYTISTILYHLYQLDMISSPQNPNFSHLCFIKLFFQPLSEILYSSCRLFATQTPFLLIPLFDWTGASGSSRAVSDLAAVLCVSTDKAAAPSAKTWTLANTNFLLGQGEIWLCQGQGASYEDDNTANSVSPAAWRM